MPEAYERAAEAYELGCEEGARDVERYLAKAGLDHPDGVLQDFALDLAREMARANSAGDDESLACCEGQIVGFFGGLESKLIPGSRFDKLLPAAPTAPEEVQKLRTSVNEIDSLAQGAFSEIAAVAKLALKSLETPDGYRRLDDIAHALNLICQRASVTRDGINCAAEEVGCNYVDEAQARRWKAATVAHDWSMRMSKSEIAASLARAETIGGTR